MVHHFADKTSASTTNAAKQHARNKGKHRMQWVRLEMAASLCPMHRRPHGSLLVADPIIYPKKHRQHRTSPGLFLLIHE